MYAIALPITNPYAIPSPNRLVNYNFKSSALAANLLRNHLFILVFLGEEPTKVFEN